MVPVVCSARATHWPKPLTLEQHHVIPQAWQHTAPLATPHHPLFDPRTVPLCPTDHRNVHFRIVEKMRALALAGSDDIAVAPVHKRDRADAIAQLALTRWVEHGGSLRALWAAGLLGEA